MDQRPIGGRSDLHTKEHPMTMFSKSLIAAAAFAAMTTSAFAQVPWEFNPGMAYLYNGSGNMAAVAMASGAKNHDSMMKHAKRVPIGRDFLCGRPLRAACTAQIDTKIQLIGLRRRSMFNYKFIRRSNT
jgi:hypothetical protein